jgi:hypothetical protein
MPLTLEELKELLIDRKSEQEFMELLDLDMTDLVHAFSDIINDNFEWLEQEFTLEDEDD